MRAAAVMVAVLAVLVPIVAVWVRTDPDSDVTIDRLPTSWPFRWTWEARRPDGVLTGGWTTTKVGARLEVAKAVRR